MLENMDDNEEAGSDLESDLDTEDIELQVGGFLGADSDKQGDGGVFWWRNVFSTSSSTIILGMNSKWAHFRGVRYFNYGLLNGVTHTRWVAFDDPGIGAFCMGINNQWTGRKPKDKDYRKNCFRRLLYLVTMGSRPTLYSAEKLYKRKGYQCCSLELAKRNIRKAFVLVSETLGPYNDRIKKFVSARVHSGSVNSWSDVSLSKIFQHLQESDQGNPSQILLVFWSSVMHATGVLPCALSDLFQANDAANSLESILGCHFMHAMSLMSGARDVTFLIVHFERHFGSSIMMNILFTNQQITEVLVLIITVVYFIFIWFFF